MTTAAGGAVDSVTAWEGPALIDALNVLNLEGDKSNRCRASAEIRPGPRLLVLERSDRPEYWWLLMTCGMVAELAVGGSLGPVLIRPRMIGAIKMQVSY